MGEEPGLRQAFQVAYVSDDADDHSMNADELGPALLAFAKLIQAANRELNADRATVKLLVTSNFEHKCFNINFEAIQTILDQLKDFLDGDRVKNINDLLKSIGIITTASGVIGGTLLGLLKLLKGRKVESVQEVSGSPNSVILKVEGDFINVGKDVLKLAQSKDVLQALDWTLAPVKNGKEAAIEFRHDDKPLEVLRKPDVEAVAASCEKPLEPIIVKQEDEKPKTVTATLHTYGPVFDPKAPNWRFKYRKKPIYADIRETKIAKDAVARGGAFLNDRYKVKMEVTPPKSADGDTHYKIVEVLEFTQAEHQIAMSLKKPRKKRGGRGASR